MMLCVLFGVCEEIVGSDSVIDEVMYVVIVCMYMMVCMYIYIDIYIWVFVGLVCDPPSVVL
jgi:hypothetical protein